MCTRLSQSRRISVGNQLAKTVYANFDSISTTRHNDTISHSISRRTWDASVRSCSESVVLEGKSYVCAKKFYDSILSPTLCSAHTFLYYAVKNKFQLSWSPLDVSTFKFHATLRPKRRWTCWRHRQELKKLHISRMIIMMCMLVHHHGLFPHIASCTASINFNDLQNWQTTAAAATTTRLDDSDYGEREINCRWVTHFHWRQSR